MQTLHYYPAINYTRKMYSIYSRLPIRHPEPARRGRADARGGAVERGPRTHLAVGEARGSFYHHKKQKTDCNIQHISSQHFRPK